MKRLFKSGLAIALLSVFFVNCSSDNNTNNDGGGNGDPTNIGRELKSGEKLTLEKGKKYNLSSKLIVNQGATLEIQEGVEIVGTGGTSSYIAVAQGAKIYINGTKENPVVMTALEKKRGSWGGLVICGKAPINKAETATAEVSDLTYGGTITNDSSGSIRFLRIEYAGANFNSEKEFNGLSLFGVGSGTTIEYVQAHEGSDDGFEWFGGTVSAKYLVSTHNDDDSFDWTEGWNGQDNEFWFVKQGGVADKGIEADNNSKTRNATPYSDPTIKNLTMISAKQGEGTAMKLREGTKGKLFNVVLDGWKTAFDVEHDETIANVENGSLLISNVQLINVANKAVGKDTAGQSVNVNAVFTEGNNNGAGNSANTPEWAKGWTKGL